MNEKNEELHRFLSLYPHYDEYEECWPVQGKMRVRIGLTSKLPSKHVMSSILSIVLNDKCQVLYLYPDNNSDNISHLLIYYHSLGNITNSLTENGFLIERVLEPLPTEEFKKQDPIGYEKRLKFPSFIHFKARKK